MVELNVAGATVNQTPLDFENNTSRILEVIEEARSQKVNLLCLPELCITGYGCEDMFLAQWVAERAMQCLLKIMAHTEEITICVGLPVSHNGLTYNTSCLISNKEIVGFYAKQYLANDGIHYEKRWFEPWQGPGDKILVEGNSYPIGNEAFEVYGYHIGFEICEDAWQPSNLRPAKNYKQPDIILNPSASHFAFGKWKLRKELAISSSKQYDCMYVYANLLGNEAGRAIYDGDIYISEKGKLLAQNNRLSFRDWVLVTKYSRVSDSFIEKEEEFLQAESLALFDYWRKSKSHGFVLSLSGGADSSTCAILVCEMWKRVHTELSEEQLKGKLNHLKTVPNSLKDILTTVYQGTSNSSHETLRAAEELANETESTFFNWNIDEEVDSYTQKIEKALGTTLSWDQHDIPLQNIQARARAPIVWMLANIKHALLLATSNRSEASVGYATMDGDTAGSISPIAGVDKTFIRTWLVWAEKHLGYHSLKYVNQLEPTAELRPPNQKQEDEKDLMPYEILNEIEHEFVHLKQDPDSIAHNINGQFNVSNGDKLVSKFLSLWQRNQWKRERYAPSFHLDDHNVDSRTWMRYPILSGNFT